MLSLKKRSKNKVRILNISDDNNILYTGPINELPILNSEVIAGSIEFYDDPEPCMIHRSAVISRYYIQIESWLDVIGYESNDNIHLANIPEEITKLIDFSKGTRNEK